MSSANLKHFAAAVGATAIWGTFSIPLRNLKEYPPNEVINYRLGLSLIITWLIILLFRKDKIRQDISYIKSLSRKNRIKLLKFISLAGLFLTGNWVSFLYAVNYVNLKSAAFGYMICPLITAMGGFFLLKEHLSITKLSSIGIALISVFLLAHGSMLDVLWSIFIAATYSSYLLLQRVIVGLDKLNVLGLQLILSALVIIPLSSYFFGTIPPPTATHFWTNILVVAFLFTVVPLFLVSYSLIGIPSSTLGIIVYLNPIIAFSIAFLYFEEEINQNQLIAYSLLLASVFLFNWGSISILFDKQSLTPNFTEGEGLIISDPQT
ncbi:MAG: EamA family transporter [Sphingobacteriaceae bacterium]|jgi:chloramphenicol-sensitive protein RarD|nr:MAG: permease [Pedobacter sp.]